MALTLLQLIEQVTNEIGITEPSSVIGHPDQQVIQLLALSNRVGWDLARSYEWRRLVKENVFETVNATTAQGFVSSANTITGLSTVPASATSMVVSGSNVPTWAEVLTVSGTTVTINVSCTGTASATTSVQFWRQDFDLPSDFDRAVSRTNYSRGDRWPNLGPKSPQEWQWLKSGTLTTGPRYRYRIFGNKWRVSPPPTSKIIFANEYVSNRWVMVSGEPTLTRFAADSNTFIFPDDVMVLGLKYQWYKTKGLDFQIPLLEFADALSRAKAMDQDNPNLSLAPNPIDYLIGTQNIQEGNYPG